MDFAGPPGTYPTYSLIDVVRGEVPDDAFDGKLVIVGPTDPAAKDLVQTPTSDAPMPGPEFQANSAATVLDDFPLRSASGMANVALLLAMGLVAPLVGAAPLRPPGAARRRGRARRFPRLRPARLRRGQDPPRRRAGAGPPDRYRGRADRPLRARHPRAPPPALALLALRAARGGERGRRPRRRRPAPRRGPPRRHRDVLRPARLHDVLRGARAGGSRRGGEPLPLGDDRRDPRRRRHPRLVHGRRDHGPLRRPDRAARPRRPGGRRFARDARRASPPLQRLARASAGSTTSSGWASASTRAT